MTSTARHLAIISAVAIVVLFTNLGGPRLWDRDEPRNAGCTYEMLARGDYVTPVFDGELRTHKPILLYWFMMSAYALFGINEFSARFWSAALGVGTAWLTYGLGRRLFSAQIGFWAAIVLVTTLMFDVAGRAATPDSLLIFWSTAAIFVFVRGTYSQPDSNGVSAGPQRMFPRWPVATLMYGMMGMAVLAKGPVGVVLPTAVIGMYLLLQRLPAVASGPAKGVVRGLMGILRPFEPRHFLSTCWLMRPITAIVVVLIIALPWYVAVGMRTDGAWLRGFFLDHNLRRAAQSLEGHNGSFLFYPCALLVGFFPWSVFAVPTLLESWRRMQVSDTHRAGLRLAVCWVGVYVGLFSLAKTKLPSYITPCYPAVAMLVASYVVAWMRRRSLVADYWPRIAILCLGMIGLAMAVGTTWAANEFLPGEEWLALLGCIPMLTAVAALGFAQAHSIQRAAISFSIGAILLTTSLFAVAAARVDRHQQFEQFIGAAYQQTDAPRIGTLGVLEPSWVFYTRQPMDHLCAPGQATGDHSPPSSPEAAAWQEKPMRDVWRFLDHSSHHYVITTSSVLKQMDEIPPHVKVISRSPYFLRNDELLLLATHSELARYESDASSDAKLR